MVDLRTLDRKSRNLWLTDMAYAVFNHGVEIERIDTEQAVFYFSKVDDKVGISTDTFGFEGECRNQFDVRFYWSAGIMAIGYDNCLAIKISEIIDIVTAPLIELRDTND